MTDKLTVGRIGFGPEPTNARPFESMSLDERNLLRAGALPIMGGDCRDQWSDKIKPEDYEEVLADHRRLVRRLDVALNGEDGAAKQASLCDIVAQVESERWKLVKAP